MRQGKSKLDHGHPARDGHGSSSARGGLLARLRTWLAGVPLVAAPCSGSETAGKVATPVGAPGAAVLPFPMTGRGLLLRLAQDLGHLVGKDDAEAGDPVLLALAPGSQQRLTIDSTAYVDVREGILPYRVVLGDEFATRITLETTDVAEVHSFISQYLLLTRGRAQVVGGAS